LLLTLRELALLILESFELELVSRKWANSSASSGFGLKLCHQDQAGDAVRTIEMVK
jgi:hypothetical protein